MSETFTRVYENAEANASLQQALLILYIEKRMSNEKTAEIRKYFRRNCSPLVNILMINKLLEIFPSQSDNHSFIHSFID